MGMWRSPAFRFLKQLLERRGVGLRRHAAAILEGQAWRAAREGATVGTRCWAGRGLPLPARKYPGLGSLLLTAVFVHSAGRSPAPRKAAEGTETASEAGRPWACCQSRRHRRGPRRGLATSGTSNPRCAVFPTAGPAADLSAQREPCAPQRVETLFF